MERMLWSRRGFLGIAVAIPTVAGMSCGSSASNGRHGGSTGSASSGGGSTPGTSTTGSSTGGTSTGGGSTPATSSGGGSPADAGQDADASVNQNPCPPGYPTIDLKADCGAVGDGQTNDTAALQKAASILQKAGGGQLTIPPGVYIVGNQTKKTNPSASGPYYQPAAMFTATNLSCLKITGYGATLRIASGLHYGGFDPTTGQPKDASGGEDPNLAAHVGRIIELVSCTDVLIEGLELDGNNQALALGGPWGDVDRQTAATGIWLNMCDNVTVVDVHTHHHGLDGITVAYLTGVPPKKMPHQLVNVNSEYNGRQAISWIGGWGLECTNCSFNHTGRAINGGQPLVSKPGDGLDIEPNPGEMSREGLFTGCQFIDNHSNGVEAANGDSRDCTFDGCTFWGTTGPTVWVVKPGFVFENCQIYGTLMRVGDGHIDPDPTPNPSLATSFVNCTFEDKPWMNGQVFRSNALCCLDVGCYTTPGMLPPPFGGASWTGCTFTAHAVRAVDIGDPSTTKIFDSCVFIHGATNLSAGTAQSSFTGCTIKSCHFEETAAVSSGGKAYYVSVTKVVVAPPSPGSSPTHVDGPMVKWQTASTGLVGDIAPGSYG